MAFKPRQSVVFPAGATSSQAAATTSRQSFSPASSKAIHNPAQHKKPSSAGGHPLQTLQDLERRPSDLERRPSIAVDTDDVFPEMYNTQRPSQLFSKMKTKYILPSQAMKKKIKKGPYSLYSIKGSLEGRLENDLTYLRDEETPYFSRRHTAAINDMSLDAASLRKNSVMFPGNITGLTRDNSHQHSVIGITAGGQEFKNGRIYKYSVGDDHRGRDSLRASFRTGSCYNGSCAGSERPSRLPYYEPWQGTVEYDAERTALAVAETRADIRREAGLEKQQVDRQYYKPALIPRRCGLDNSGNPRVVKKQFLKTRALFSGKEQDLERMLEFAEESGYDNLKHMLSNMIGNKQHSGSTEETQKFDKNHYDTYDKQSFNLEEAVYNMDSDMHLHDVLNTATSSLANGSKVTIVITNPSDHSKDVYEPHGSILDTYSRTRFSQINKGSINEGVMSYPVGVQEDENKEEENKEEENIEDEKEEDERRRDTALELVEFKRPASETESMASNFRRGRSPTYGSLLSEPPKNKIKFKSLSKYIATLKHK